MVFAERLLPDRQCALEQPLGVGVLALIRVHDGQVVEGVGHIGVACAERLLADRQRALVEPLGVGVPAFIRIHEGQVAEGRGHIGVVFAERLLADRERALEQPLGVGILALFSVHGGQAVEGLSHFGVVLAERLVQDRQRALVEPLGLGVLGLRLVHVGQVVECVAVISIVDAKPRLHSSLVLLRLHERRGIIACIIEFIKPPEDRVEIALLCRGWGQVDDHKEERARQDAQAAQHNGASSGSDETHRKPPVPKASSRSTLPQRRTDRKPAPAKRLGACALC